MILLCILLPTVLAYIDESYYESNDSLENKWRTFKKEYNRTYYGEEDRYRMKLFEKTLRFIIHHNERYRKGEVSDKVGVNHFADWTEEEFNRYS
ncbi:hypothetical protein V5799_022917 [Amblyomma americanum]|uniref:Cathepsin propeptide inhibitor domain-containing protein n=1 Tax=Amblyomma americanum TaxID=6943 RepID=A0AAQ4FL52_AMBAM